MQRMRTMYDAIPTLPGLDISKPKEVIRNSNIGFIMFYPSNGAIRPISWLIGHNVKAIRNLEEPNRVEAKGEGYIAIIMKHFSNIVHPLNKCRHFVWTGEQAKQISVNWGYWQ